MLRKPTLTLYWIILLLCGVVLDGACADIARTLWGPRPLLVEQDSLDVWIFFTDRGFASSAELQQALSDAEQTLRPEARWRRSKVKIGALVSEADLPICADYTQNILRLGARYRCVSRYFNALSVRTPVALIPVLAEQAFVGEIRPVAKGIRREPQPDWEINAEFPTLDANRDRLSYGPSFAQLQQINVIAAHDAGFSGEGVLVCLLDTGFFTDHEALVNQSILAEWDFINNDPETQNEAGDDSSQHVHGTFTFSALGGAHDGDLYGPAYGATFILGKTESITFEEPIEEDWYVAGLEWADSLGAQVVSTSLGYFDWYDFADLDGNTALTSIGVDLAIANGMVVVTAAGNERGTSWGHIIAPADADSVIAVGAVLASGLITSFSSPGPTFDGRIKPEVCARGSGTWCADPRGGSTTNYSGMGGTSLATPLVGGACALILEAHPNWTPQQVRLALMSTASRAAVPDNDYGWGIINTMAAINYNFAPRIMEWYPATTLQIVPIDSIQVFGISAEDGEGDPLLITWQRDDTLMQTGGNTFSTAWHSPGDFTVRVMVSDNRGGLDSAAWQVQVEPAAAAEMGSVSVLDICTLYPNYPNPFNGETQLRFDLPFAAHVTLSVFDVHGKLVAMLLQQNLLAGQHRITYSAAQLPSGIYFAALRAGQRESLIKLVLIK